MTSSLRRSWVAASVLAAEHSVAEVSARLVRQQSVAVSPTVITQALTVKEREVGRLTDGQRNAVSAICANRRGLDLIVGTAGAGKTTALDAVRLAYQADGNRVLGAATSGQAARALGQEAAVESRTIASLLWRLRTGTLTIDSRTVLLLDEAGMTDDRDMLAVLKAAEHAYAKVVVIGDHRQLSAVGLGGGLEGLLDRHADAVHVLDENVRQHDPAERAALAQLRNGDTRAAVDWYVDNDRLVTAPTRDDAVDAIVERWMADERAGKTTLLLAWKRVDVAALNQRTRAAWAEAGHLVGPDYVAPGGRAYAVGDRVVALAPHANGALTTSERGTVARVDADGVSVVNDAGRTARLVGEATDGHHLDHAYAVTVHRAQGATVDRAHLLADGGGRELAYVAMSRARETTHVHVIADDAEQTVDDLRREWSLETRDRWVVDTDAPAGPGQRRRPDLAARVRSGLRAARLRIERDAVLATLPPDRSTEIYIARREIGGIEDALKDLRHGRGEYADTPVGDAARELDDAQLRLRTADQALGTSDLSWRTRRTWKRSRDNAQADLGRAHDDYHQLAGSVEAELTSTLASARDHLSEIEDTQQIRDRRARTVATRARSLEREIGIDHGIDVTDSFGMEL